MIVDAHCHLQTSPHLQHGSFDADGLVTEMDASGVDVAVVSAIAGRPAEDNEAAARACDSHSGRILGYINLDLTDLPGALTELERWGTDPRFRGVKLHPANHVWFPFEPTYNTVYERIEALSLPVLWHSGTYPTSLPLQIATVAQRFPGMPCILAHFGLDLAPECFPSAALAPNIYVDITANPIVPLISTWLERFGAGRLLWGSDHPLYRIAYELARVDALGVRPEEREAILAGNAKALFHLEATGGST